MVSERHKMKKHIGQSLGKAKSGNYIASHRDKGKMPMIINYFGCLKCSMAGTPMCPHGIKAGGHHSNWICSFRVDYLKSRWEQAGNIPKMFQQETLFGLSTVLENMYKSYHDEGDLPDDFKHIAKLVISLTDKMRRQDEGIKIAGEINVTHDKFRDIVEIEAKKIEEQNNRARPAEFTEEVSDS